MPKSRRKIGPLFSYYGSKWRIAGRYPEPEYDTIIEPFAGAAGYSQMYPWKNVILFEPYEPLYRAWKFLIESSREDILALPFLEPDQLITDLDIPQGARDFIGYWLNNASTRPNSKLSKWARQNYENNKINVWGPRNRERVAEGVEHIKHWEIYNETYDKAPDIEATWYVDPPYIKAGKFYPLSGINYERLASWCKSRKGQVMVCEADEANWLPFQELAEFGSHRSKARSWTELIWTNSLEEEKG